MNRPNKAEGKFLLFAYNHFYDIFEEVFSDSFWRKRKNHRFNKIKDAFSIYVELLNYEPITWVIEHIRNNRPPMEAEIGTELFRFVRNVVVHFPYFTKWEDVWIDNEVANWHKKGLSIDKFLTKYEGNDPVKYRMWDKKKKKMTYLTISFPKEYTSGKKVFLEDIMKEKEGVRFSLVFMRKIIDTQVEEVGSPSS